MIAAFGGVLYGWALTSGGNEFTFFSYDTATATYKSLYVFPNGVPTALTYHKGILYGVSNNGGTNKLGSVFSYNIATGKFRTLYNFSNTGDGDNPVTAPVFSGGYLYVLSSGTLLKMRASNGAVIWKSTFTQDEGGFGVSLILHNGTLYGTNSSYGASGRGTLFSANAATGAVSLLYTFSSYFGNADIFANDTLWGAFTDPASVTSGVFTFNLQSGTGSEATTIPGAAGAAVFKAGKQGYALGSPPRQCGMFAV